MSTLDPTTIRRLAFIKYLYGVAVQQSASPELIAAASLLTFHDSVEMFLRLASEHINAGAGTDTSFMGYWPLISAKLPTNAELAQKDSMQRLNKARVNMKHHGTMTSKLDIEAFRASTTAFFQDNTPLIFALNFDEISLIEFVRPDAAQARIKSAIQHMSSDQLDPALDDVAIAFDHMLYDYEERKRGAFRRSPFFFGRDLAFQNSFFMGLHEFDNRMAQFVDRVKDSIESMQSAIKVLALGLDYRRYSKFMLHTPNVGRMPSGEYQVRPKWPQPATPPTKDDVQFCIDFVVETAIHLNEFDYDVPAYPHPESPIAWGKI